MPLLCRGDVLPETWHRYLNDPLYHAAVQTIGLLLVSTAAQFVNAEISRLTR